MSGRGEGAVAMGLNVSCTSRATDARDSNSSETTTPGGHWRHLLSGKRVFSVVA